MKNGTFLALLTLLGCLCVVFLTLTEPSRVKIVACDVGQGDAIIVEYGEIRMLIDSGPNSSVLRCLPQVPFLTNNEIDFAILSHWDKDHVGGFASVLQKYKVGKVFANSPTKDTQVTAEILEMLKPQGGVILPEVGDSLVFPGMRLRFLWNEKMLELDSRVKPDSEENGGSIAIQLAARSFGFLAMGDLECDQELAVTRTSLLTPVEILKVSHHGAKTSSCLEFLEHLRPEIALISSGRGNSYGHPSSQTLDVLRKLMVFPLRTDQFGTLSLTKTPTGWSLKKGPKSE